MAMCGLAYASSCASRSLKLCRTIQSPSTSAGTPTELTARSTTISRGFPGPGTVSRYVLPPMTRLMLSPDALAVATKERFEVFLILWLA